MESTLRPDTEGGTALIGALMVAALLGTLGGALVLLETTESAISANHRAAQQAFYAADAALERAIGELRAAPDWTLAPQLGSVAADLDDGAQFATLSDGTALDLPRLTGDQQADTDAIYEASPNRPVWRALGHAPLARLLPVVPAPPPAYIVVWIADDADELDDDPSRDTNGVLVLRSEAFGLRGARRRIEATVAQERSAPAADGSRTITVRMIGWRQRE